MNRKIMFVLIALIGIGLYALPSTMALFAGQHSFVNIDATGNQIECEKCHGDVKAELGGQSSTVTGTEGPHANFECEYCHRVEAGASSGDNAFALVKYESNISGVELRTIFIGVRDMEDQNYPKTLVVNATNVPVRSSTSTVGLIDGSRNPGYALSPVQVGFETNDSVILTLVKSGGGVTLLPTYDPETGEPLDTSNKRYDGLSFSGASFDWIVPSHGDPYWMVNMTGRGSEAVNPGSSYHAASLVSCMECHGGADHGPLGHYSRIANGELNPEGAPCSDCHYGPLDTHNYTWREFDAGGFGLTIDNPDDTGAAEAHMEFVTVPDNGLTRYGGSTVINNTALYASNGACVACHTHVKVDITYTKPTTYTFDVDMSSGSVEGLTGFNTGSETNTSNSAGT